RPGASRWRRGCPSAAARRPRLPAWPLRLPAPALNAPAAARQRRPGPRPRTSARPPLRLRPEAWQREALVGVIFVDDSDRHPDLHVLGLHLHDGAADHWPLIR